MRIVYCIDMIVENSTVAYIVQIIPSLITPFPPKSRRASFQIKHYTLFLCGSKYYYRNCTIIMVKMTSLNIP